MIEQYDLDNTQELQDMFPALDGSEKIKEIVVPKGSTKSFYYQRDVVGVMSKLQNDGYIVLVSFIQRQEIFTPEIIETINSSIAEQKAQRK